jgi:nitrate/nitrite transporter NarK
MLLLSLVWLLYADNLWMLYVFGAIYGLAHGSFFTFISPIVVEIFGLISHGAIFGIVVFSGTAGGSMGPIIAGMIFDATDNYTLVFKILTTLSIVVFGLVTFLKPIEVQVASIQAIRKID